ncbi:MAG: HAMP domain-containing protein [Candidatus Aminicenantes bacterium]|nr:HAMP domain-containing protein [Candidatus Aminicenantes bacterium]
MRTKTFKTLTFKLTIWYIVILGTITILAGVFLYQGFKDSLMDDLDEDLLEIADHIEEKWRRERGVTWRTAIQAAEQKYTHKNPFIQVVELAEHEKTEIKDMIHTEKIPSGSYKLDIRTYCRADRSDIDTLVFETIEDDRLSGYPIRVFLMPVRGPNILQVGISTEETTTELSRLQFIMIAAGVMLLLLASVGGSLIIRKALQPVNHTVNTAKKITADDLSLRIETKKRQDEIGALVETFNDMIARLEKSVKKIRQFSGDVSHELRTPLTIIRGEIEVLLRKERKKQDYIDTLNSVHEESLRMEKIIDDLLFLSRAGSIERAKLEEKISLDEITKQVFENRKISSGKKGLSVSYQSVRPNDIKGNRELLERMITNLVDNAIRYTPSGGRIEVRIHCSEKEVILEIKDTGIGIPEEALPFVFDRFYVVDKSRSRETGGTGLGLSIVKWIAESHNAEIEIHSKINEGTTLSVRFPLFTGQS